MSKRQKQQLLTSMESHEYYTDPAYLKKIRRVMGPIELDPATCEAANTLVQATRIFTKEHDGLIQNWKAKTLFLNNPYNEDRKPLSPIWAAKFVDEFNKGHYETGFLLVNAKLGYSCMIGVAAPKIMSIVS